MQFERTRMYQVKAVAEHFGVHPATIYRAIEAGELRALRLGSGRGAIRVPGGAIEDYANACGTPIAIGISIPGDITTAGGAR